MDNQYISGGDGVSIKRMGQRVIVGPGPTAPTEPDLELQEGEETPPDYTLDGLDDVELGETIADGDVLSFDTVLGIWTNKAYPDEDTNTTYTLTLINGNLTLTGSDGSVNTVEIEAGSGIILTESAGVLRIDAIQEVVGVTNSSDETHNIYVLTDSGLTNPPGVDAILRFVPTFANTLPVKIRIAETGIDYPVKMVGDIELVEGQIQSNVYCELYFRNGVFYAEDDFTLAHRRMGTTAADTIIFYTGRGQGAKAPITPLARQLIASQTVDEFVAATGLMPESGGEFDGPVSFTGSPGGIHIEGGDVPEGAEGDFRFNPTHQTFEGNTGAGWETLVTSKSQLAIQSVIQNVYIFAGENDVPLTSRVTITDNLNGSFTIRINRVDANGGEINSNLLLEGDTVTILNEPDGVNVSAFTRFTITSDVTTILDYYEFTAVVVTGTTAWAPPAIGTHLMIVSTLSKGGFLGSEASTPNHDQLQGINEPDSPYQHISEAQRDLIGQINAITVSGTADAIVLTNSLPNGYGPNGLPVNAVVEFVANANNTGITTLQIDNDAAMPIKSAAGADLLPDSILAGDIVVVIKKADHWVLHQIIAALTEERHNDLAGLNEGDYQHLTEEELTFVGRVNTLSVTGTADAIIITPSFPGAYSDANDALIDGTVIQFAVKEANTLAAVTIDFDGHGAIPLLTADDSPITVGQLRINDIVTMRYVASENEWRLAQLPPGAEMKTNHYGVLGTTEAIELHGTIPNAILSNGLIPDGVTIQFFPVAENTTTAVTVSIDGAAAYPIKRAAGGDIAIGDLNPSVPTVMTWNAISEEWWLESRALFALRSANPVVGCIYRFVNGNEVEAIPVSDLAVQLLAAQTQEEMHTVIGEVGVINHVAISGTTDAIVGTNTLSDPEINGGTVPANYIVEFVPIATNTGATTFQLGDGDPLPVQSDSTTALVGGEIVTDSVVRLAYKGTYWELAQAQAPLINHADLQEPNAEVDVQHLTTAQVALVTEINKVGISGTSDAIVATLSVPDPVLITGTIPDNFILEFIPKANNTGAVTLDLHGRISPVKLADGSELSTNTLLQDVICWVMWKTDHWVITNPKAGTVNHNDLTGLNAGEYQHLTTAEKAKLDKVNTITVSGSGAALKVTNSFPDGHLVGGVIPTNHIVRFVTPYAAAVNATFALDSSAPLPIKDEAGVNIIANAFLVNDLVELVFKGTHWLFLPEIEGVVAHNSTTGLNTGNYIHLTTAERNTVGKANAITVAGTGDAVVLTSKLAGTYFNYGTTTIADGTIVDWVVKASNTTTNVTVNLDANGVKALLNFDGSPLEIGYLAVGDVVTMRYVTASNKWQLIRQPAPVSKENFLTCTGTATNIILTSSVAGSLLVGATIPVGRVIEFTPTIDNTGATTLELDGAVAVPIVHANGSPTIAGDIMTGVPTTLVLRADGSWQIEGGAMIAMKKMDAALNHTPLFVSKNDSIPTYISPLAQRFNACATPEQMRNIVGITPEGEAFVSDYETHEYLGVASAAKLTAYRPVGRNGYQYRAELAKKGANISNYVINMLKSPYDSTPLSEGNEILKGIVEYPVVIGEFDVLSFISEADEMLYDYPDTTNTAWTSLGGWIWTTTATSCDSGLLGDINDGQTVLSPGNYFAGLRSEGIVEIAIEFPSERIFQSLEWLTTCGVWSGNFVNVKYINSAGNVLFVDIDCRGSIRPTTGNGYANYKYNSQYIDQPIRKLVFEFDTDQSTAATSGHPNCPFFISEVGEVITYPVSTTPRVLLLADGNYYSIGKDGLTSIGLTPDWSLGDRDGRVYNAWLSSFTNAKLVWEFPGTIGVAYDDPITNAFSGTVHDIHQYPIPVDMFETMGFDVLSVILDDYPVENTSWSSLNGWIWTTDYSGVSNISTLNDGVASGTANTYFSTEQDHGIVRWGVEFPEERVFESMLLQYSRGIWPGNFTDVEYIDAAGNVVHVDINVQGGSITAPSTSAKDVVYTTQYRGMIKKLIFVCDTDQCTSATSGYSTYAHAVSEIGYVRTSIPGGNNTLLLADGDYYAIGEDAITLIGPEPDWEQSVTSGSIDNTLLVGFDSAQLAMADVANVVLTFTPRPTAIDGDHANTLEYRVPVNEFNQLNFSVTFPTDVVPRVLLLADGQYYAIGATGLTLIGAAPDWVQGITTGIIENAWLSAFNDVKLVLELVGTLTIAYTFIRPQISIQKYGVDTGSIVSLTSKVFDDNGTGIKVAISKDGVEFFTFDGVDTFTSIGSLTPDTIGASKLLDEGFDKAKYDAMTVAELSTWMGIGTAPTQFLYWAYATNDPEAIIKTHTLTTTHEGGYAVQPAAAFTYFRDRAEVAAPAAGDYIININ